MTHKNIVHRLDVPCLHVFQAKRELEELQQQEPQAQAELPDFEPQAPAARRQNLHLAMHISVGLAGLCAWWYYLQDVPALERKLMSVLLSPVRLKHDITCFQLATCCHCTPAC